MRRRLARPALVATILIWSVLAHGHAFAASEGMAVFFDKIFLPAVAIMFTQYPVMATLVVAITVLSFVAIGIRARGRHAGRSAQGARAQSILHRFVNNFAGFFSSSRPSIGRMRVRGGPRDGDAIKIAGWTVLGRSPDRADQVVSTEDTVSRRHCQIRFDPSRSDFEVCDLGSRNGTFVIGRNGGERELSPSAIERCRPGETIRLGKSSVRLTLEA